MPSLFTIIIQQKVSLAVFYIKNSMYYNNWIKKIYNKLMRQCVIGLLQNDDDSLRYCDRWH